MSKLFDRSISSAYSSYFEPLSTFKRAYASYNLDTHKLTEPKARNSWEPKGGGIPLAYDPITKNVFVDHSDAHTLIIGPTGSKKTRLLALPTVKILSEAGESMIISDPKAELYERAAEDLKAKGYLIQVINIRSPNRGNQWNPLHIPYHFYMQGDIDRACEFANDVAENLMAESNKNDPFWSNSASAFLFGMILTLFRYCKEFNKPQSAVTLRNLLRLRDKLVAGNTGSKFAPMWKYAKEDTLIASAMLGTMETAKDTQGGILSTLNEKLRSFSIQPNLLEMLSANDIDLEQLGKVPTAVFLITPDEKTTYHRLVSLFVKQSYEYLIFTAQRQDINDHKHIGKMPVRVNYILDEFSSLPVIQDFPAMVTAARSRNIRFNLIIQSRHQLFQKYNKDTQTILSNCTNWLFLTSREYDFLNEISSLCGNSTGSNTKQIVSVTDLQRLDKSLGEALVICNRYKPHIARFPDIDEYDSCKYSHGHLDIKVHSKSSDLDFDLPTVYQSVSLPKHVQTDINML